MLYIGFFFFFRNAATLWNTNGRKPNMLKRHVHLTEANHG